MTAIVLKVRFSVKERLVKRLRHCREAGVRLRYLVIINVLNGRSVAETEAVLKIHNTTVYRILKRFQSYGEAGLEDGRADNGSEKVDDHYLSKLYRVVRATPKAYGWRRPTWTRELLGGDDGALDRSPHPCGDHESCLDPDPGAAGTAPSHGRLSVGQGRQNTADRKSVV